MKDVAIFEFRTNHHNKKRPHDEGEKRNTKDGENECKNISK
jgi:hypothetical protein